MIGLRYFYLRTSSQVKRLESVARSPLYSHISLTLQGLSTIRALGLEERMTQDMHLLQDQHACTWYHYMSCHRWFGIRLDQMTALVITFAVFYSFFSRCLFSSGELVGFSLPLLLSLGITFQCMVRQSGEVEILMVSVDRVLNYCKLAQELVISSPKSDPTFVTCGDGPAIEFRNVHFEYSDNLPLTLRDVSLSIRSGEKIGIVGRTGAGKSSLFNSLLRINPISSGSICIDSRDIASLDLYEHRKRISVIPQDSFLFSGTLKYNLDPFREFSEDEIWSALEKAFMKRMVKSLSNQLMANVEEDGLNFSTGERQLLCLARAILRNNKIILIDEATANVDMHTDALVQQTIKSYFSDCTVLTIAHRIETIVDSDRIIILDKGTIVESDIPHLLLQNEDSYLSKLVSQLESSTQSNLRAQAEKSYTTL
ncbi:Multidrug resistance-associated protein 4-like [Oopsacas minuta]|uniref:Multidrug resistance-associated protein 4-like n=1 Tax=Oopsacas minuta TaxID=111878 RepID=A0AAV7JN96_9METZ|nr:Multidrug resistance-associated protein 4-like [Oopsacas minuta]